MKDMQSTYELDGKLFQASTQDPAVSRADGGGWADDHQSILPIPVRQWMQWYNLDKQFVGLINRQQWHELKLLDSFRAYVLGGKWRITWNKVSRFNPPLFEVHVRYKYMDLMEVHLRPDEAKRQIIIHL